MLALKDIAAAQEIPTANLGPTEVEAKFAVEDPALLQQLATHKSPVSGYCFGDPITKEQHDVYLDTPDYRLLRHGYQLRVRASDGQWHAALKSRGVGSEVGIYHRLEVEEPLDTADRPAKVDDLPEPIVDALSGLAGKQAGLGVICALEQTRRVRAVTSESPGRKSEEMLTLVQLYLDEIRIRSAIDEAILARAWEVEIELTEGLTWPNFKCWPIASWAPMACFPVPKARSSVLSASSACTRSTPLRIGRELTRAFTWEKRAALSGTSRSWC